MIDVSSPLVPMYRLPEAITATLVIWLAPMGDPAARGDHGIIVAPGSGPWAGDGQGPLYRFSYSECQEPGAVIPRSGPAGPSGVPLGKPDPEASCHNGEARNSPLRGYPGKFF